MSDQNIEHGYICIGECQHYIDEHKHYSETQSRLAAAEKERDEAQAFLKEEHAIVQKVWKALGKETYRDCKPYTIWQWVEKDKERITAIENALREAKAVMEKTTLACCTFPVEISSEDLKQVLVEFSEEIVEPAIAAVLSVLNIPDK